MQRLLRLSVLTMSLLLLASCGSYHATCTFSPGVAPLSAEADHAAAPPKNQVQFTVVTPSKGSCPLIVGHVGSWATSDPVNTTISNDPPTAGLATCLSATTTPVTITNDGQVMGYAIASSALNCM